MRSFVDIHTFFDPSKERTVTDLSDVYSNRDELLKRLGRIITKRIRPGDIRGKTVLLKPNWVRHSQKLNDEYCLRTHDSFLLAALEVVLSFGPTKVVIGDAPIQGCIWDLMIGAALISEAELLSKKYDVAVDIVDFRRKTFLPSKNNPRASIRPIGEYLVFDLGEKSYLEPVSSVDEATFRVTCYDPDRLKDSHSLGVHKYCITKQIFEADVVISMPKIKTHQKTGITGALKNLVGVNGDKDFLPHHRIGGTSRGGDCYPGGNTLRYWSELAIDNANRRQGKNSYWFWQKTAAVLWRLSFPKNVHQMAAGWYGNDTCWRMVMDLNMIASFGNLDGVIHREQQRVIFSLCDAIIGGQGDGPLDADPLPMGIISFSNNSYLNDICMARLMGFDTDKIPLLAAAVNNLRGDDLDLSIDERSSNFADLRSFVVQTQPPRGWVHHLRSEG